MIIQPFGQLLCNVIKNIITNFLFFFLSHVAKFSPHSICLHPDLFPRIRQNSKNSNSVLSPSSKNAKHLSYPIVKARYQSCSLANGI